MFSLLRYRGDSARDRRHWRSAIVYYYLYTRLRRGDAAILIQLGHAWKEAGKLSKARQCYERALTITPSDADLHLQVGHLHKVSGNLRGALGSYSRAVEIDPNFAAGHQELAAMREILGVTFGELPAGQGPISQQTVPPGEEPDHDRDRSANAKEAGFDIAEVEASNASIGAYLKRLPALSTDDGLVPRALHFVCNVEDEADIPYYGYLAIKAALHFNPNWDVYLHCLGTPRGPNLDRVRGLVSVLEVGRFEYWGSSRFFHSQHKADIIRLLVSNRVGGVCLSLDTMVCRSFDELRRVEFCLGIQAAGWASPPGLHPRVMVGRPRSSFSTRWLERYQSFRSLGHDGLSDYHSLRVPVALMLENPDSVTVLGYRAFAYPLWYSTEVVLLSDAGQKYKAEILDAYCYPLWSDKLPHIAEVIDDNYVRNSKSIYAELVRTVEHLTQ